MKSKVEISNNQPKHGPCLYKNKQTGVIVLFRYRNLGFVVYSPIVDFDIGDKISTDLLFDRNNVDLWERLPEGSTVTLTQTNNDTF